MAPFFMQSHGAAIRAFSDLCDSSDTMCGKHPADYTLFSIGDFDDQKGLIVPVPHVNLGSGIELQAERKNSVSTLRNVS